MKCLIVLMNSGIPDIVFMSADAQFIRHANEVAVERGLVRGKDVCWERLDLNIATQFFSPIVASHGLLACELDNAYCSITCENGSLFVHQEFGDHLYIAFNGDGEESEDFLSHKLMVFHRIVGLHFGPVVEQLRPDNIADRNEKWRNLGSVLNTWLKLYNNEQCFLFEAIERLQVNQVVNEMCINLLESTLKKMRNAGEKNAVHTMLLVNAKLLSLFSSRNANELQPSDILLLTIMACDIYPSKETLEDMFSHPYTSTAQHPPPELLSNDSLMRDRGSPGSEDYRSTSCDADFHSPSSSYYSPHNTPEMSTSPDRHAALSENMTDIRKSISSDKITHPSVSKSAEKLQTDSSNKGLSGTLSLDIPKRLSVELDSSECFHTPHADVDRLDLQGLFEERGVSESEFSDEEIPPHEDAPDEMPSDEQPPDFDNSPFSFTMLEPTKSRHFPKNEKLKMPIFLHGATCRHTPHMVQFVPILPGITLIILSEVKSSIANLVCKALIALEPLNPGKVERRTRVALKRTVDELDTIIKKIRDLLQKFKGSLYKQFRSLDICWENCRKFGLFQYADSGIPEPMSPRLESAVAELKRILKTVFSHKYLIQRRPSSPGFDKHASTLDFIQKGISENLSLYQQYLSVKSQRNITMTTYLEKFPGLVHFIYIDRSADLITAPAVNVTQGETRDGRDASMLIHDKVWSMAGKLHTFIKNGYISVAYRQGDFFYSYFLWFEDTSGRSLECREPPKVAVNTPAPGILATNFYKNLIHTCFPTIAPGLVQCYELMCIHLGVVPIQFVVAQSQKLALWLWETGDIQKPIPLL